MWTKAYETIAWTKTRRQQKANSTANAGLLRVSNVTTQKERGIRGVYGNVHNTLNKDDERQERLKPSWE